jgi:hypothetical protein
MFEVRGQRLAVKDASEAVGSKFTSKPFRVDLGSMEAFRASIFDYDAYPAEQNPQYKAEQINFTYLLSLIDVLRVQLFDDDPAYHTLTYGINNAKIKRPLYSTDNLIMTCTIKSFEKRGKNYWMTTFYEFFVVGDERIAAQSELISCLVSR